jgi:uncharacterized phage protein gp47/JayE
MTQVTAQGFERTRLDERVQQLFAAYRLIYGEDISLDPDDLDGEFLSLIAEAVSNVDQLAEDVYNAFNPNNAIGVALSLLVQLNSIRRIAGAYSTADLTVGGSDTTFIPAGSLVRSTYDNSQWVTTGDVTIGSSGNALVSCRALTFGARFAPANTITKIDTPIFGWQSVTNLASATPGRAEESDEELRQRRKQSTATASQGIVDGIYGTILNIPNVRLAKVYENETDDVDANGQAPHSLNAVVEGGDIGEIAMALYIKRSAGVTMLGAVEQDVVDSQGHIQTMRFDRPTDLNAYITVNVTKLPGYPVDGATKIKDALAAYGLTLDIGQSLLNSRLYNPVNTVPNQYVTSILVGTAPAPSTEANINPSFKQLVNIDPANIVVNET